MKFQGRSLIQLLRGLPDSTAEPGDAQSSLFPEILQTLALPQSLVNATNTESSGNVVNQSFIRSNSSNVAASTGQHAVTILGLIAGLYNIRGHFTSFANNFASLGEQDALRITPVGGTAKPFVRITRFQSNAIVMYFDFNILINDNHIIDRDHPATGVGEEVFWSYVIHVTKYL